MKIDLHIHTRYSADSISRPKDVARRCIQLGIVPAITDHNSINAHQELGGMGFGFIPGEEVRTDLGDLIGLYINEPIARKTGFLETLDKIREQGGLSYLPHMYDGTRHGVSDEKLAAKTDIIEVYNPRCIFEWQNAKALETALKLGKTAGAGSDSHFVREIGGAYIECAEFDFNEPKELLKCLRAGKVVGKRPIISMRGITTAVKLAKKVLPL